MTSHREAPKISKDPVADNTDLYAFRSPDRDGTITIISNFIPLEEPAGGPNFYKFGDDVLYGIHIDNNGDAIEDISFLFRFKTQIVEDRTFLYATGQIDSLDDPNFNIRQSYDVIMVEGDQRRRLSERPLATPPVNIGPGSTPNYESLASAAIHVLDGIKVFAGQRREGFYVDLAAAFDLLQVGAGVDTTTDFNVHSVAIQVPTDLLTSNSDDNLGVWSTASRQKAMVHGSDTDEDMRVGPFRQVSRLGNPLINEVVIPLRFKDKWNASKPVDDDQFLAYYEDPEVPKLLNLLFGLPIPPTPRHDLMKILLTGIQGVNKTGNVLADMLRLNPFDAAGFPGFPNGRRVEDDVVDVALQAMAGKFYPVLKDPSDAPFSPSDAANNLGDSVGPKPANYLPSFPYLGTPHPGKYHVHQHAPPA